MLLGMLPLYKAIFMTERIQNSIGNIKDKISSLLQGIDELKNQNSSMSLEIQSLKQELEKKAQIEQQLNVSIDHLNQELEVVKKQVVDLSQAPVGRSESEIDELVKEIDYCIEQLKK